MKPTPSHPNPLARRRAEQRSRPPEPAVRRPVEPTDDDTSVGDACCAPLLLEAPAIEDAEELAATFKVLSDPVRLRLFSLVATSPQGEVCGCDLQEPVERSQATVSHHLSLLVDAGLLEREKRGKWAWFRAVPDRVAVLRDALGPLPGQGRQHESASPPRGDQHAPSQQAEQPRDQQLTV